jgi:hypothetical protein
VADPGWKREFDDPIRPHALANCPDNFGGRTEETGAARNVGKGLVDGIRSTRGVKSPTTLIAASPSRW